MKRFLQNIKDWLGSRKDLFFPVIVVTFVVCLLPYPAFTTTLIATIIFSTASCLRFGHLIVDFPGTAIVPYSALSAGVYFTGFSLLQYLHWKGKITFEIEWLPLSAVAFLAIVVTLVICYTINRVK